MHNASVQSPANHAPRRRLFVVVSLVLLGLISHGTYAGSGDEPHYLAIAHSLAFDFDLDLSNNYGAAEPLIAGGNLQPESHIRDVGGAARPVHDVGMPLLFSPFVRAAAPFAAWSASRIPESAMRRLRLTPSVLYRHLLSAAMIALAGLLACLLFDALLAAGASRSAAFWIALVVALSPPLEIFSVLFFTELLSALLCLVAFRPVARLGEDHDRTWGLAGFATGVLLLVHVRNVGLVAALVPLAVYRLRQLRATRAFAAFAAPLAAVLLLRTAINHHLWSTYLTTPHATIGAWPGWMETIRSAGVSLAGMLLDQEYGLLPYAPVFVIAGIGLAALWRIDRALLLKISAVAGCYVLAVILPTVNIHGWTGGWSPPARFLVPVIPLLALALPAGIRVMPRALVAVILVAQIAIDAYVWQHPKNLWNDGDGRAAICTRGGARVCDYLPSFVRVR